MRINYYRMFFLFLFAAGTAVAQPTVLLEGTVLDSANGEPVAGASVRLAGKDRGTFTSSKGTFRISLQPGRYRITVSSIGYSSKEIEVSTQTPKVTVRLAPSALTLGGVSVTADLSAEDVVRQAISRKEENLRKLNTFQGLLYSKFNLSINGDAFGQIKDADRAVILETFSRNYYERERGPRIEVIQRRQTANVPAASNLFALGNFFSFYDDVIPLLNARVMSPLSSEAFSRYRFSFQGRTAIDDQTVWIIEVVPTTTVLPAFEGTLKIIKGTYNVIEVDLRPTRSTAISFVDTLHFTQKFERFGSDIWQPTYLRITGRGRAEIVKGIAEVTADFDATSIFTEVEVNGTIPDSVFAGEQIFSAAPGADTVRTEFWEENSLSELSESERATYQRIDSIVANTDTATGESLSGFSYSPILDFNRVSSLSAGATAQYRLGPARLDLQGSYSFGLKQPFGRGELELAPGDRELTWCAANGAVAFRLFDDVAEAGDLAA